MAEKSDGPDKNGRLYDKAGKVRKIRHEQKEADGEGELVKEYLATLCMLKTLDKQLHSTIFNLRRQN